eukprot:m.79735 g.79735  ORF g.79735 m.79735 type:complete len:62 (+) comp50667_c0_seq2:1403-1588(+)
MKDYLKRKVNGNYEQPFPLVTDEEKAEIVRVTGLRLVQVTGWFYNRRKDQRHRSLKDYLEN